MNMRRLIAFLLITFGISWGVPGLAMLIAGMTGAFEVDMGQYAPLSYLAIWAPAIAALVVVGVTEGGAGLRAFLGRLRPRAQDWPWYVGLLVGVPLLYAVSAWLTDRLGMETFQMPTAASMGAFAVGALLVATQGPLEELGWRGFLLPTLQKRMSGIGAAGLVGVIWATWHVPAIVMGGELMGRMSGGLAIAVLLQYYVLMIAWSVLFTIVFNGTAGTLLPVFLFHWLTNLPYPWETTASTPPLQDVFTILAALALGLLFRRYLGRRALATAVTPGVGDDEAETLYTKAGWATSD